MSKIGNSEFDTSKPEQKGKHDISFSAIVKTSHTLLNQNLKGENNSQLISKEAGEIEE